MAPLGITRCRVYFLWGMLLLYAIARISQLYADRLPTLLIVVLHVVPPALFALACPRSWVRSISTEGHRDPCSLLPWLRNSCRERQSSHRISLRPLLLHGCD